jgi:hypothetical protein
MFVCQKDYEKLLSLGATPDELADLQVVVDRFGAIPEGRVCLMQEPPLVAFKAVETHVETGEDWRASIRYSCEMQMPKLPILFFGVDPSYVVPSRRQVWTALWRLSSERSRARMRRRCDWRSNVKRVKRARELARR